MPREASLIVEASRGIEQSTLVGLSRGAVVAHGARQWSQRRVSGVSGPPFPRITRQASRRLEIRIGVRLLRRDRRAEGAAERGRLTRHVEGRAVRVGEGGGRRNRRITPQIA